MTEQDRGLEEKYLTGFIRPGSRGGTCTRHKSVFDFDEYRRERERLVGEGFRNFAYGPHLQVRREDGGLEIRTPEQTVNVEEVDRWGRKTFHTPFGVLRPA